MCVSVQGGASVRCSSCDISARPVGRRGRESERERERGPRREKDRVGDYQQ